jgi:NAD(P)-dependent dehydrogenase (short-subunit alcohol dehydrogenase family)
VNVSSIGGLAAGPVIGAYHMSKFGLEALTDTLRRELRHLGVDVVAIEPGTVRTDIWTTSRSRADDLLSKLPTQVTELYGHLVDRAIADAESAGGRGVGPEVVAAAIVRALTGRRPRARYLVGADARIGRAISRLPARLVDRLAVPAPRPRRVAV